MGGLIQLCAAALIRAGVRLQARAARKLPPPGPQPIVSMIAVDLPNVWRMRPLWRAEER